MRYESIKNDKIKNLKKLNEKKYRDSENKFLIEGEHLINEAYKNNILEEVFVHESLTTDFPYPVNYVTDNVLKYISTLDNYPKMIGVAKKIESKEIKNKILILDDIQDPGNLGTIIRSAVAFNIDTIVLSKNCVDIYNSKVLRATQGMIFNINIVGCDIYEFILDIKNKGYKIYGTKVDGGNILQTIEKTSKFAIIMGNEGNGVKKEILDLCSDYIYIKMNSNCESLNVGVATSIILYELDK